MYLFVSFLVTLQSGICLASTMLPILGVKDLNGESYTLYWNLKSSFSFSDAWRPGNETLSLLHVKELGRRFSEENAFLTINCTAA